MKSNFTNTIRTSLKDTLESIKHISSSAQFSVGASFLVLNGSPRTVPGERSAGKAASAL